jgi:hypothetical protein
MDAGGRCCSLLRNWAIRRIGSSATVRPGLPITMMLSLARWGSRRAG